MNDGQIAPLPVDDVLELVRDVATPGFGAAVLRFVSRAGMIRNFGTFYCKDLARPGLTLTIWSGAIGSYWFKRNATQIAQTPEVAAFVLDMMRNCPAGGERVDLYRPDETSLLYPMYRRARLLERCSVTSRTRAGAFHTFFLRSKADGPIDPGTWADFRSRLRVAQEFILLRHRLAGTEAFRNLAGSSILSLRERGATPFDGLSLREAEICDAAIRGMSVAATAIASGVAESTVRTLRRRAYRKLGIVSALELASIVVKDSGVASDIQGSGRA